jgi:hypothetical protein
MPSGITNLMNNIRRPAPEKLHDHRADCGEHELPPVRDVRRKYIGESGHRKTWPRDLRLPAVYGQHVNPARDLRKGRRLRAELR